MALEVIGAGFGRTGTLSLKLALEQLGYMKCHHMMEVMRSDAQADYWKAIGEGKPTDWDKVFDGFKACVDFPASVYYRELFAKYPDAKVVLTVRSADSWWASASETIFAIGKAVPPWLKAIVPRFGKIFAMHDAVLGQKLFKGGMHDEASAKATFNSHIAEVKAAIPPERLLVYEVKQGWAPLCAFLGKPVPEAPFPNVNDSAEFKRRIRGLKIIGWAPWGLIAILAAIALYVALTGASAPN
jgi:hypothetical protein